MTTLARLWRAFRRDLLAMISLVIIGLYTALFLLTSLLPLGGVHTQAIVAQEQKLSAEQKEKRGIWLRALRWLQTYNADTGKTYAGPSSSHWLGTDRLGRDIFKRLLVSVHVAFKIGLVTALISCFLGMLLGGMAGYYGGKIDLVVTWVYSVFASVPYILLVLLISAIFRKSEGLFGVYVAFCATYWIGPARVVRAEVMKIKQLEYVQAAVAIGLRPFMILWRHVLPNTLHLVFVYFSLIFISAIKSEVILSFLGLGVKGMPSWGLMIEAASKEIIASFWWQMIGASVALFLLVYAFNIFTDALQDALDPRHVR